VKFLLENNDIYMGEGIRRMKKTKKPNKGESI